MGANIIDEIQQHFSLRVFQILFAGSFHFVTSKRFPICKTFRLSIWWVNRKMTWMWEAKKTVSSEPMTAGCDGEFLKVAIFRSIPDPEPRMTTMHHV